MIRAGVEYGEIYTGEATIFLHVPDDPSTVYYALSVPKGDVGSTTGWSKHGDQPNRLHLTAVGQAVAFTLRALQTPPRDANWRARALRRLKIWNVVAKDIEEAIVLGPNLCSIDATYSIYIGLKSFLSTDQVPTFQQ
jgi:hypothetical protein